MGMSELFIGVFYSLFFIYAMVSAPLGFGLAVGLAIHFRGIWWRVAACLPTVGICFYYKLVLMKAWETDPTAHNLWPIELALILSPHVPFLLGLWWIYRRRQKQTAIPVVESPSSTGPSDKQAENGVPLRSALLQP